MDKRTRIRLTKYSTKAGWGSKFAPGVLEQVLLSLTPGSPSGDSFVSSMETRDDAGFIPFGGGLLLQSVDFFPPIVDDPYQFGQIAAANALSDVYAMGGYPLTAMNLVGFPGSLDLGVLREILAGGQSKIEESGARLCGGHSVQDEEPKYGLSVTGFVEDDRVVRNAGAKAGDALVLTKPLGFGQIAAANALSDVYAMGGRPLTALNLVGFPSSLDLGVLREILAGGQSKIEESGAKLCGGHSVQDEEPKYGLSVTGFVEEDRVVRNAGAKAGDALVLTKPLGFGILTTALKRDIVSEAEIEDAVEAAASLNKAACAALREVEVSAATDVTGYGFLGHLSEMLEASTLGAVVRQSEVPVWERSVSLAAEGYYPGGLKNNREYLGEKVIADGVGPEALLPLYDPQTSGGLLVAVPQDRAPAFVRALEGRDTLAAVVGEVAESQEIRIVP